MKLSFDLGTEGGSLTVTRCGDRRAKASGFTKGIHGWGAEIHLLTLIRLALNPAGFNLASIKVCDDGHLYGDDHMRYLRTPTRSLRKGDVTYPYVYIVDGSYAVRSSAEEYNKGQEVRFEITGNPFHDYQQADWYSKIKALCDAVECDEAGYDKHEITCELCGEAAAEVICH